MLFTSRGYSCSILGGGYKAVVSTQEDEVLPFCPQNYLTFYEICAIANLFYIK